MNVHAKPVEFPVLTQLVRGEPVNPTPESHIEPPPSIYQEIQGQSYLSKQINAPDTPQAQLVNSFILEKMKASGLADNPTGYKYLLKDMLKNAELTDKHDGIAIVDKLYKQILDDSDPKDHLVLLNILIQRERQRGR